MFEFTKQLSKKEKLELIGAGCLIYIFGVIIGIGFKLVTFTCECNTLY